MLYGMSTIEIIENLIIEKFHRKSGDTTVSDDRRRIVMEQYRKKN